MFAKKGKKSFGGSFRNKKPETTKVSSLDLIHESTLIPGNPLPLIIQPAVPGLSLKEWTHDNIKYIEEKLLQHGGILFRGFEMNGDADFADYVHSLPYERMPYFEGSTPRQAVGDKVYTSTMFPSDETIALHNEYSSSTKFPMKVWFFCTEEPEDGGETPIASTPGILNRLDPEVRDRFERLGWMLIRNFGDGLGLPWRRAYAIEDPDVLERYVAENEIEMRWKDDAKERLWTRQVRSAILEHPITGTKVWFNHMSFWHAANLNDEVLGEMLKQVGMDGLPYHTYYGDGSPIPDSVARDIANAYLAEKIKFRWQKGDLMWADNMLISHGREAFTGPRKIRVAMGEPFYRPSFEPLIAV